MLYMQWWIKKQENFANEYVSMWWDTVYNTNTRIYESYKRFNFVNPIAEKITKFTYIYGFLHNLT